MPADPSFSDTPQPRRRLAPPLGLAALVFVIMCAVLVLARKQIAEYVIEDTMESAGLSGVSLNVTRFDAGHLVIENLAAEEGALQIPRIEANFTISDLLHARLKSLAVDKPAATLSWDANGVRMGGFALRPNPDEPLTLPAIGNVQVHDGALHIATPAGPLEAPFSLSADTTAAGSNATIAGAIKGPGVNVVVDWKGLIATDLAQSNGHGTFQLDIKGFALPGLTDRLDAQGLVTLAANNGVLGLTVNKPLTFSFDAPPLGVQSLDKLPWSVTIAPSTSDAALVLTRTGDQRALQFDVTATAQAGSGKLNFALAGEGAQTSQAPIQFKLTTARTTVVDFPAGGGKVSGHITLSDLAGTAQDAQGRLDAELNVSDVALAGATLDQARGTFASTIRLANGVVAFDFRTLEANVSRAKFGAWTLAAPARLGLAPPGSPQTVSFGLTSGLAANVALTLPALTLRNSEDAALTARVPDIKLTAKGLDVTMSAAQIALDHPSAELRDGRIDAVFENGTLSAKGTVKLARIGPAGENDTPQTGALTTTAALTTRGEDFDIRGTFVAPSGIQLGDFTARVRKDASRGTATISIPKKRFERGGKFDAADLGFVTPVTDLTGTLGLDAKTSWDSKSRTESATVIVDDVGFAVGDVSVAGLSTTVELSGLMPLRSAKPHHITAQSISAGMPLTGLAADFAFNGDETATVTRGTINIAGGQLTTTDIVIPLDGRDATFPLGVQKIDMSQLSALAKVDGLSVTGTLSGTVPLRAEEKGIFFTEGLLSADAPGRLVYKPATPPEALAQNQGGSLLLQALSNFAYDRLAITLNGPVTEDIVLGLSLAGKNPDLYGGYPIEFNLNLSGRLTQILRQGVVGYGIPADIERQIREGQKPATP